MAFFCRLERTIIKMEGDFKHDYCRSHSSSFYQVGQKYSRSRKASRSLGIIIDSLGIQKLFAFPRKLVGQMTISSRRKFRDVETIVSLIKSKNAAIE